LKYSGGEAVGLQRCVGLGDYDVFWGSDEILLVGLSLGCRAAVGSTYNLALPHYRKLLSAFDSGDMETARRLQAKSLKMVDLLARHGVMPSLKAAQTMTGYEVGGCRLPFKSLSEDAAKKLIDGLDSLGIVES
jgi:N-acetylneuraminate lyase